MERATDSFVIWMDAEPGAAARADGFVGRVEHVQSAERGTFETAQELLAFLAAHRRDRGAEPGSGAG